MTVKRKKRVFAMISEKAMKKLIEIQEAYNKAGYSKSYGDIIEELLLKEVK